MFLDSVNSLLLGYESHLNEKKMTRSRRLSNELDTELGVWDYTPMWHKRSVQTC